jgi:hypothetical protein
MKLKSCYATLVALAVSMPAGANTTYSINKPNADLTGYSGPYASVDVGLTDSTHATITFTALSNAGWTYLLADGGAADVNVNASSWTIDSFAGVPAFDTGGALTDGNSGQVDGFGVFNQTVNSFDGFTRAYQSITFVLTNDGGTWADSGAVLSPNVNGYRAAAHIFVWDGVSGHDAAVTGFAAAIPEPGTYAMLLAGLGMMGFIARRRSQLGR